MTSGSHFFVFFSKNREKKVLAALFPVHILYFVRSKKYFIKLFKSLFGRGRCGQLGLKHLNFFTLIIPSNFSSSCFYWIQQHYLDKISLNNSSIKYFFSPCFPVLSKVFVVCQTAAATFSLKYIKSYKAATNYIFKECIAPLKSIFIVASLNYEYREIALIGTNLY